MTAQKSLWYIDKKTRIFCSSIFSTSDICKRIMIERSLQIDSNSNMHGNESRCATRPTDLPTENRRWARHGMYIFHSIFFFYVY